MADKKSMFWNWLRWQCLNQEDWNDGEIPEGTMIDEDQFLMVMLMIAKEGAAWQLTKTEAG